MADARSKIRGTICTVRFGCSSATLGSWVVSLAVDAGDAHLEAVEAFAGSNEQSVAIAAAEANVGGPLLSDIDVLDLFAGGVEHRDTFAGEVNVAFVVDGHAIGTERAKESLIF